MSFLFVIVAEEHKNSFYNRRCLTANGFLLELILMTYFPDYLTAVVDNFSVDLL